MALRQQSNKGTRQKPKRAPRDYSAEVTSADIGALGWARWIWRQLTSMRTALILLLLMAVASVPGSLYPQRTADPNGVTQFFQANPQLAQTLDRFQLFDVYSSAWFSAIYILLFISLVGCVLPRIGVHWGELTAPAPLMPRSMSRMPAYAKFTVATPAAQKTAVDRATAQLKRERYRLVREANGVRAEKGYLRETGNLLFHASLLGVLLAVGIGGAFSYSGQRVLVEGETFVNNLAGFDSFTPGLFFNADRLTPMSLSLTNFSTTYDLNNPSNRGIPIDFRAQVVSRVGAEGLSKSSVIRVNEPLELPGSKVYLTGNGYAPVVTIFDGKGNVAFDGPVVFLPQDSNMTSLGVIKVPDASPSQFGIQAFFYPTAAELKSGALTSAFPAAGDPLLTMFVYKGNLGLDSGLNSNVFQLNVHAMKQVAGGKSGNKAIELAPGQSAKLPDGLGRVYFTGIKRYASLDITYNPGELYVLAFAILAMVGLVMMLFTKRRRVWVKIVEGGIEVAALSKHKDSNLDRMLEHFIKSAKIKNVTAKPAKKATK